MTNTKRIAYLALFMAIQVVLSFFYIPILDNLRIYFTFLIMMLVAHLFNYPWAAIYAIAVDLVSYMVYPTGAFFPGYTLTSFVAMTLYWIFLHQDINLKNVILARLSVNLLVNVGLNSLWSYILYSKAFLYYATTGFIKNIILLPIEIILFMIFYRFLKNRIESIKK